MIVRMIVVTTLGGVSVSPGDGSPLVGMLPAKAVPDNAQARATVITKRFMGFSFEVEGCKNSDNKEE
jgi:hypothetical protein